MKRCWSSLAQRATAATGVCRSFSRVPTVAAPMATSMFTQSRWCSSAPNGGNGGNEPVFENPYEQFVSKDALNEQASAESQAAQAKAKQAAEEERLKNLSSEEKENMKDEQALSRAGWFGALGLFSCGVLYFASDYARQQYYGREGSTKVNVETRGRPSLGGPFTLVTTKGEPVNQAIFLGQWTFFYFGFTHCPEICPIELNRMSKVVDEVREKRPEETIVPLFVSCDPRRDSLEAIDEYLSVFHPDFVGLVGTPNQVNEACKSYRIYYSIPDDKAMQEEDYLIDHSIAIFLFDPNGKFVDFFGNRYDESEITAKVLEYMDKLKKDPTWTNW